MNNQSNQSHLNNEPTFASSSFATPNYEEELDSLGFESDATAEIDEVAGVAFIEASPSPTTASPVDLTAIYEFLGSKTPDDWVKAAINDLPTIIQDHANCEKKAAGTAMNLIFRYEFSHNLQCKLAQLIREEMLHYEQVIKLMNERGQSWQYLSAGRYAKGMLKQKRTHEPAAMIDVLIIGAFIEARSCERFAALAKAIDDDRLARYYRYLLKSESRHFEDYLALAQELAGEDISGRVAVFRQVESELICSPDPDLRFHSGLPV